MANPKPSFGDWYWVFHKLTTNLRIVGYGEAYSLPFHPKVVEKMIKDILSRHVPYNKPFQIEKLWRENCITRYGHKSDTSLITVLSAIEIECWDTIGKELDRPIVDLALGQARDRLRSCVYLYPETGDVAKDNMFYTTGFIN